MTSLLDEHTQGTQEPHETPGSGREIRGLLVKYKDDEIDECVHLALQGKKRVHYKCMDVCSNFVALGTSVGAIYLFRLTTITHASCKLVLVIPCDQGSIDVIKFLPGSWQANDLLVAIGTSRGSLVIFQLTCLDESTVVRSHELYRAEEFTKSLHESSVRIKLIEYDQDLCDSHASGGGQHNPSSRANNNQSNNQSNNPNCSFTKLYICDQRDRLFVLESSSIFPAFRLLYSQRPSRVLSVAESTVNQICAHRAQLLMATDEKAHIFREHTNELVTLGKKQRKTKGFFGACFFNPNHKPARLLLASQARSRASLAASQPSMYSSANSLLDSEELLVFVARPKFSLWQVNNRREVMLTLVFDSSIKATPASRCVELNNAPLHRLEADDYSSILEAFASQPQQQATSLLVDKADGGGGGGGGDNENGEQTQQARPSPRGDHFERLIPIFSSTLGNLLLSYSKHELFVIDPISARLIVWYQHDKLITQICCNENEIFILSELGKRQFKLDRLILLAPTQLILELHRTNRFLSLMAFVQMFADQLRQLMALPLNGPSTITTEGGLLRNIVWSTWRECSDAAELDEADDEHRSSSSTLNGDQLGGGGDDDDDDDDGAKRIGHKQRQKPQPIDLRAFSIFKRLIDEILEESRQLKQSIENLADSQLLFTVSTENIERLCSEPYASMISLDINISNLHTNHVVHFNQEALQRHRSIAKLSQSIMNLGKLKKASTQASLLMDNDDDNDNNGDRLETGGVRREQQQQQHQQQQRQQSINFNDKRVVVEQLQPKAPKLPAEQVETERVFNIIRDIQHGQLQSRPLEPPDVRAPEKAVQVPVRTISLEEEFEDLLARACKRHCIKCKQAASRITDIPNGENTDGNLAPEKLSGIDDEEEINFSLFRKFVLRKNVDIKWAIGRLLQHPDLLNSSKIPADFYLQAIANYCGSVRSSSSSGGYNFGN